MSWPTIGERLPRAAAAVGVRDKLANYCLNLDHEVGGPKARGFQQILGIGIADIDHLEDALRAGVRKAPISAVRDETLFGVLCEVRIPVAGVHSHSGRVATVTTAWLLQDPDDRPRLVTAYIDG